MHTCNQCDKDATASVKQEPLCDEHAEERLEELQEKRDRLEEEFEEAKERYNELLDKYDVDSYGQIEHQLNVEGREDIDESDVQAVNEVEDEFAIKREELRGVEVTIENLKRTM